MLIASVKAQGFEGLVTKRRASVYEPGLRSGAWIKIRVNRGREFVLGRYGPPPPGPPVLTSSVAGNRSVFLAWTLPATGAAVTGYQLQAGTAPGLSDATVLLLPSTPLAFGAAGVPAGTYFVRIVATSALGLGFVSNEVTVVVP